MDTEKSLYTLFIIGNFKGRRVQGELLQPLIPITADEKLKFIYEPFTMMVQFDSDIPKEELEEYIKVTYGVLDVEHAYLIPKGEEVNIKLPKKIQKNLHDLENNSGPVEFIHTKYNFKDDEESMDYFDNLVQMFMQHSQDSFDFSMDDDVDVMLKPKEYVPTLDEILERILENGIDSLSLREKILLDKYSNDNK